MKFDVLVVGAGITGLTAAYLLKKSGKRVCVLERDRLGQGDTVSTTAHLTSVTDLRLAQMARRFGKETCRAVWDAGAVAINTVEQICREETIDCEFHRVPGFLHASLEVQQPLIGDLQADFDLAREIGIAAELLPEVPIAKRPGIRFPNQAKFHPLKYLSSLARIVHGQGSCIFEDSEVEKFLEKPWGVKVNGKQVRCDYVVIATHVPLQGQSNLVPAMLFQSKLAPYSSYAIGARIADDLHESCYWDTSDPYNYLRIDRRRKGSYAIFGGQDHKTGQVENTNERFEQLERRLLGLFPQAIVDRRWSGQVIETADGLPYIGETAERQFAATGYSGNGMTFGTLAAIMACDAVWGRKNPWRDIFSVDRKPLRRGAWNYLTENIDYPYFLLRDRLKPAEAGVPSEMRDDEEGRVVLVRGQRVACSRDPQGNIVAVSAVCTHMGCIVHWNAAERTWDCPCHGSRFKQTGEVLAGPAETPLKVVRTGPSGKKRRRAARARP